LPSSIAAVPRICATEITPVPPMPTILIMVSPVRASGAGMAGGVGTARLAALTLPLAGRTVRKDGQSPSTQE
jgi:hypothetical protein